MFLLSYVCQMLHLQPVPTGVNYAVNVWPLPIGGINLKTRLMSFYISLIATHATKAVSTTSMVLAKPDFQDTLAKSQL